MKYLPQWLQPLSGAVALLIAAVLISGMIGVPARFLLPTKGYDQPRLHENTKNTTRFSGASAEEVADLVSKAVYPATMPENTPDLVLLYDPQNWQIGLQAASLLKPLNAVLLPSGSEGEAAARNNAGKVQVLDEAGLAALFAQVEQPPRHAIMVDPNDMETALLAAPWAAFSGDRIVFHVEDAPKGVPLYVLGSMDAPEEATRIAGNSPAGTAVAFAKFSDSNDPSFGWGMNAGTTTGYRSFTLALPDDPATALLSANLARRGKPGPLLWAGERTLPQATRNYLWSQRAAFWASPSDGPFHHTYLLGDHITFPAQSQADYALEIGPYRGKGAGMSGIDMLATAWAVIGLASAAWIFFHSHKFLPGQNWIMRMAWPLAALFLGPFGLWFYILAHRRSVMQMGSHQMWDRPLWLQGLVATVSAVGFGAAIMIATGYIATTFGLPLIPNSATGLFWLGAPMVLVMIVNYIAAVLVSWPLFQAPMIAMFYDIPYGDALKKSLPLVLASMAAAALAMNPGMWWLMMMNLPMMPTQESILWFGVMLFTGFLAFLMAWPLNYLYVRQIQKSGLM